MRLQPDSAHQSSTYVLTFAQTVSQIAENDKRQEFGADEGESERQRRPLGLFRGMRNLVSMRVPDACDKFWGGSRIGFQR